VNDEMNLELLFVDYTCDTFDVQLHFVSLNAAVALRESQRCLRLCDARMGFAYPTKWNFDGVP